jgi:hypothetical protein
MKVFATSVGVVLLLSAAGLAFDDAAGEAATFTLTKRADSGAYGAAAFSFRTNSQDIEVHKNYVDLVYNGCGLLHTSPVNGQANRICDLGEGTLDGVPVEKAADAKWHTDSIRPKANHVYLEAISAQDQTMLVKFRVDEVAANKVKISWKTIMPLGGEPMAPNRGRAGTKGQCTGHAEE